jgi:CubicO group peptidase (beta-lactamase class C family)
MPRTFVPFMLLAALLVGPLLAADSPDPTKTEHHRLAAEYSAGKKGVSLLVMVDGQVLFEDYPGHGRADRAWELASGTKSFCGALLVAAAQDGLLTFDERVADTIPEWKSDARKGQLTLRQLLSLTSGIEGGGIGRPPTYADALKTPAAAEPGAKFQYGPAPFQIFGEVMRRKLAAQHKPEEVLAYLHRRVLDPIGLQVGSWRKGIDGQPHLPSGAALTAREWARYGELVRLGGKWHGKQVLDAELLDECFVGTKANPAYGLSFWLRRDVDADTLRGIPLLRRATDLMSSRNDIARDLVFAAGAGNQRLYVSRELKLVVVRQAEGVLAALAGRGEQYSDVELLNRLLLGQATPTERAR